MEKIQDSKDVCKEVLMVLSFFDEELINKIPTKVIRGLMEIATESEIEFYVNENKGLNEQNISEESKNLIALIYYNYIADESEKIELVNIWNNNEEKYQDELRKKYTLDDIFKNKREIKTEEQTEEKSLTVVQEEKWYQKIFNLIKRLFGRNKNSF